MTKNTAMRLESQRFDAIDDMFYLVVGHTRLQNDNHGAVNPVRYFTVDAASGPDAGAPVPTPRRAVVEITRCNNCHDELALHGRNRIDNPQYCAMCWTASSMRDFAGC